MTGNAACVGRHPDENHIDDGEAYMEHGAEPAAAKTGAAISPGVRATLAATVVASAGTGIPIMLSMPMGVLTITSAGVLSIIGALGIWETGVQIVDGVRRMANGPAPAGAHVRLAAMIRNAIDAIVREDDDVALHRQLARDAMRGAALKQLDDYVDRRPKLTRRDRKVLIDQVEKALTRLDAMPREAEVDSVLMERVLHELVDPMLSLIDPPVQPAAHPIEPPAKPSMTETLEMRDYEQKMRERPADRTSASMLDRMAAPASVEPPKPTPMETLERDMREMADGSDTIAEIERLRTIIREVGTDYLDRERRREISTLLDVHLPAMAKAYAKAADIAAGDDLNRLRRRTLQGLQPVLGALREAHAECLRHAEDEVDARARFMEARHPRPPEELDPHG